MKPLDGKAKLQFCDRLGPEWTRLALYFNIPTADLDGFKKGDEPRELLAWLERRCRLDELPEALEFIGRTDLLADLFEPEASDPTPDAQPCWQEPPYPGLTQFTETQAPIFLGRDQETAELRRRLVDDGETFIAVVGASGSGKSSLIRAGLIPTLPEKWLWKRFTPAEHPDGPFAALAAVFAEELEFQGISTESFIQDLSARGDPGEVARLRGRRELLLFIDQFEELYAGVAESLRHGFGVFVHRLAATEGLRVVLTLRADFYHYCAEHPRLAGRLRSASFPLAAPEIPALHAMITGPAERAGLDFEPGLAGEILRDTGQEPGRLALMAYALYLLHRADGATGTLTLASYDAFGGVEGAIGEKAREVFEGLDQAAQQTLGAVFRELVNVDDDGTPTRRRASLALFTEGSAARRLIDAFSDPAARLLVRDGQEHPVVEVAHEALFRSWARLREWIEERHDDLRLRRQLGLAVAEWQRQGQADAFLWPEERLHPAREMVARLEPVLTVEEQEFLRSEAERLLEEIDDPATGHFRRAEIGDRLDRIGDPRPGVGLRADGVPDIVWCEVPGGEVTLEEDAGTFQVEPFWMAKYLLTYRQYRAFVEAEDGYRDERWREGFARWDNEPGQQGRPYGNHPAENVSWFDALALCRWLSYRLGYEVRLPTEWEWQQAATGGDAANEYPWGREWDGTRANTRESGLSRTTAVGMYPAGVSPVGALDLSGNLWEWCRSDYEKPRRISTKGSEWRMLRGGSWGLVSIDARAAYRSRPPPGARLDFGGFRVVCSSPILEHPL